MDTFSLTTPDRTSERHLHARHHPAKTARDGRSSPSYFQMPLPTSNLPKSVEEAVHLRALTASTPPMAARQVLLPLEPDTAPMRAPTGRAPDQGVGPLDRSTTSVNGNPPRRASAGATSFLQQRPVSAPEGVAGLLMGGDGGIDGIVAGGGHGPVDGTNDGRTVDNREGTSIGASNDAGDADDTAIPTSQDLSRRGIHIPTRTRSVRRRDGSPGEVEY